MVIVDQREERGQVQCCCTSPKTVRSIRDRKPRTATSTFTQLLSSDAVPVQSTETIRTIRDREPRTATSTFTQLLSSEILRFKMLLDVHRDHKDY